MADNSQVIQEFLTSLGFKVDENGLKKFVGSLGLTSNAAVSTGKAVLGIAVAAEAMVVSFASSMEKLYYASRRTNASVENIQALEFGSKKIGLAAGVAREALEGMAAATRMNPGLRSLIDGLLGKDTASLDQAQIMIELVQKLSSMPHYQGAQYASLFGMDEKTFLMLKQGLPELIKAEEERRQMNRDAGIDAQKAAEAGKEYANSITDITTRLGVLRDRMAIELLPSFREFNKQVIEALDNANKFKLSEHPRQAAMLKGTAKNIGGAGKSISDAMAGAATLDGHRFWNGIKGMIYHSPGTAALRYGWHWLTGNDSVARARRTGSGKIGHPADKPDPAPANLPSGMRRNNPGNIRKGANDFQTYATPQDGLSAMAGNLLAYHDKYGLNNIRDIVTRWAPFKENNTGAYIDDVSKRLGMKSDAALDLKDPAVLSKLMGAMIHHEQGYSPFGTTELLATAKNKLGVNGGPAVVMTQKTDIHVAGGDNPASTARHVASAQTDVNSAMVRNLRGAVQ